MDLPTQLLHVRVPQELISKIDDYAEEICASRSEVIRIAIIDRLRSHAATNQPFEQAISLQLMTLEQLREFRCLIQLETTRRIRKKYPL